MAGAAGRAASGTSDDLRFRVLELRRDRSGFEALRRRVEVEAQQVGDCAPSGDPAEVDVQLETVPDGVRVTGKVSFDWVGSCRRCLEVARGSATSEFEELFVDDPESWVATDDSEAEEVHPIDAGWIDLTEVVRDGVLLGLPLAPLCRPDCDGPDPAKFPVGSGEPQLTDADGDEEDDPPIDPRWAKLSEIRFDPDD
ncbi:MAG: YceD family protein [Microthrixaceae bacterium]